jgi:hypothetical protein
LACGRSRATISAANIFEQYISVRVLAALLRPMYLHILHEAIDAQEIDA